MSAGFTHLDGDGSARMVDVTGKQVTPRRAVAWCRVATAGAGPLRRPDLSEAEIAGVQAAKRVGALVPLCHPLPLDEVRTEIVEGDQAVEITATVTTTARTGVEMEALTACAVAALCLINGCGPLTASIEVLTLLEKSGGRSGTWRLPAAPGPVPREPMPQGSERGGGERSPGGGAVPGPAGSGP